MRHFIIITFTATFLLAAANADSLIPDKQKIDYVQLQLPSILPADMAFIAGSMAIESNPSSLGWGFIHQGSSYEWEYASFHVRSNQGKCFKAYVRVFAGSSLNPKALRRAKNVESLSVGGRTYQMFTDESPSSLNGEPCPTSSPSGSVQAQDSTQ